nr:protein kinase-like domain, phloem protein 2-like protein [Tanacetum cinerariifolium]
MDFIGGLPKVKGKDIIFVVVHRLTKYSHFMVLGHPYSAKEVAQVFIDNVYKLHGCPSSIISDRDPIFLSAFWKEFLALQGIKSKLSTAYHPQTDGQTEVVNRYLEGYLRCMVMERPLTWVKWVALAEWWYNTSFHSSIGMTPFEALYGFPPPLHIPYIPKDSGDKEVDELIRDREATMNVLKQSLHTAQNRMKQKSDKHRTEREFSVGSWVYLKLQPYMQNSLRVNKHSKSTPKYFGPFLIVERIGKVAYRLDLPSDSQIHSTNNTDTYMMMSSVNHDDFANLEIPLENILTPTKSFKTVVGGNGFVKYYKGQLLLSGELINILAERLNKEWFDGHQQFWTEKNETRASLRNYLSDSMLLTWVRRLEISVGIAHALSYIHYDEPRAFSVIHRNIDSGSVYLNDDWEPKLDPTYIETKRANHKSDIYSFGIVLLELLCGRKSVTRFQDNKYLAPVAIFHYREKTLDDIINPDLWKPMDPRSLNVFAEIAYDCLNEERYQRPNIDEIVTRLKKALELQLERENAEHSSVVAEVRGTSSSHEEGSASYFTSKDVESNSSNQTMSSLEYLSHLQLSFEDVQSATNNLKNIIKNKIYKRICQGRMLHSGRFIDIVVREFFCYIQEDNRKFRMEKSILSSLNHMNLVSVIRFCEEKEDRKYIIYKQEANGSLNKYLSDKTLTWMQRLKICLGVANALSYIYFDAGHDFSVIHCSIRSSKILLDDKWEPKLSGFEFLLKNTIPRRHRLLLGQTGSKRPTDNHNRK